MRVHTVYPSSARKTKTADQVRHVARVAWSGRSVGSTGHVLVLLATRLVPVESGASSQRRLLSLCLLLLLPTLLLSQRLLWTRARWVLETQSTVQYILASQGSKLSLANRLRNTGGCVKSTYTIIHSNSLRQSLQRQPWEQRKYLPQFEDRCTTGGIPI